jgi:hypothetical protein
MTGQIAPMTLTAEDIILVSNGLNEVLNGPGAIDEWEFSYGSVLSASARWSFLTASEAILIMANFPRFS